MYAYVDPRAAAQISALYFQKKGKTYLSPPKPPPCNALYPRRRSVLSSHPLDRVLEDTFAERGKTSCTAYADVPPHSRLCARGFAYVRGHDTRSCTYACTGDRARVGGIELRRRVCVCVRAHISGNTRSSNPLLETPAHTTHCDMPLTAAPATLLAPRNLV